VIVDARNGYIITNHHVIDDAGEIYVKLEDRRELEAELVGSDPKTDIAVLKVKASGLVDVPFANSRDVKVGDYTIAIGNPFGLGHTVTQGIVSAKGREFRGGSNYEDFVQTDASINPGNPAEKAGLAEGDIIVGFNGDDIFDASDIRNAVGYVQPGERADITYLRDGKRRTTKIDVEEFKEERDTLTADASDDIPAMESFSGATLTEIPDDVNPRGGDEGVYVSDVERGSKAYRAGLRKGDIIREVNRDKVASIRDFESALEDKDGPMALTVEKNGNTQFLAVR